MLKSDKLFQNKLLLLGSTKCEDASKVSQLKNLNALLLLGGFFLLLSLSTNLIQWSWTSYDNVIYLGGYIIIVICLILNYNGQLKWSTILAHIGFSGVFCAGAIISGGTFICCLINLVWMVISFRFWLSSKEIYTFSSLQLVLVIITIFIVGYTDYPNAHEIFDPVVRSIVFALLFIFLFTTAKFFTDQIRRNVKKISDLVDQLEDKNERITTAYQEMERFAHTISHDLKAPLRNMNTYSALLRKDVHKNKVDNLEKYSNEIYKNGIKLAKMIDDVLAYSKLNAGEDVIMESLNLQELISPIKENMTRIYPKSKVTLPDHGQITGSKTKLTMLMQNLIENGLKYNQNKNPEVSVSYSRNNGYHKVAIKDNGIGIPKEYQDQIFNLFSRLHSQQKYEGTGIGLSTCKKIVEDHLEGELYVDSEPGIGSTFTIEIPAKES